MPDHSPSRNIYIRNVANWLKRERRLREIMEVFDRAGILVIPLKGAILQSQIYKDSGLRSMQDIDILVHPETFLSAAALLIQQGFTLSLHKEYQSLVELEALPAKYRPNELTLQDEQGLVIDLHQNLVNSHWFLTAYPVDIELVWDQRIQLTDEQQSLKEFGNGLWRHLLSPYHMLGHLCLHLALHGFQARHTFLDIDLFIRNLPESWRWEQFLDLVNQWRLRSTTYHVLCVCRDLMKTPLPDGLLDALNPGWLARVRLQWLVSAQAILANRPTLGERYPTLVKLALIDRLSGIGKTVIKLAFPDKEWRTRNPSWHGFIKHWFHVLEVTKRGD